MSKNHHSKYREIFDKSKIEMNPVVSVKMLTYNHEKYIAKALDGVLMQKTRVPIEIIIGEDKSTDNTLSIALAYQRNWPEIIRVVSWRENTGRRPNSWTVDKLVRGKYVALCEGDDCWIHPKKLKYQIDAMEKEENIGLVHGGAEVYDTIRGKSKKWKKCRRDCESKNDLFTRILTDKYTHIYTCTVCMRSSVYKKIRESNIDSWSPEFIMGDTQIWLESSRVCNFKLIEKTLARYNVLPESAWNTQNIKRRKDRFVSAYKMKMHFVKKYACSKEVEYYIRKTHLNSMMTLSFQMNDSELAMDSATKLREMGVKITPIQKLYLLASRYSYMRPTVRLMLNINRKILIGSRLRNVFAENKSRVLV